MNQGWGSPPQGPQNPNQPQGNYPPQGGFAPQQGFYGQAQGGAASGMAIASLILGIVGWFGVGPFASIPGAIIGKMELGKIERGESDPAGKQLATIGMWVSFANFAFYFLLIGGMCILYMFMFIVFGAAGAAGSL